MKNIRQYRSRQGRSDEKYEDSARLLYYTLGIGISVFIGYVVVNAICSLFQNNKIICYSNDPEKPGFLGSISPLLN